MVSNQIIKTRVSRQQSISLCSTVQSPNSYRGFPKHECTFLSHQAGFWRAVTDSACQYNSSLVVFEWLPTHLEGLRVVPASRNSYQVRTVPFIRVGISPSGELLCQGSSEWNSDSANGERANGDSVNEATAEGEVTRMTGRPSESSLSDLDDLVLSESPVPNQSPGCIRGASPGPSTAVSILSAQAFRTLPSQV